MKPQSPRPRPPDFSTATKCKVLNRLPNLPVLPPPSWNINFLGPTQQQLNNNVHRAQGRILFYPLSRLPSAFSYPHRLRPLRYLRLHHHLQSAVPPHRLLPVSLRPPVGQGDAHLLRALGPLLVLREEHEGGWDGIAVPGVRVGVGWEPGVLVDG